MVLPKPANVDVRASGVLRSRSSSSGNTSVALLKKGIWSESDNHRACALSQSGSLQPRMRRSLGSYNRPGCHVGLPTEIRMCSEIRSYALRMLANNLNRVFNPRIQCQKSLFFGRVSAPVDHLSNYIDLLPATDLDNPFSPHDYFLENARSDMKEIWAGEIVSAHLWNIPKIWGGRIQRCAHGRNSRRQFTAHPLTSIYNRRDVTVQICSCLVWRSKLAMFRANGETIKWNHARLGPTAPRRVPLSCGNSTEEAEALGCAYDVLAANWLHRDCPRDYVDEYYHFQNGTAWPYFSDQKGTHQMSLYE